MRGKQQHSGTRGRKRIVSFGSSRRVLGSFALSTIVFAVAPPAVATSVPSAEGGFFPLATIGASTTSTSTTTLPAPARCSQPLSTGALPTTTDCLFILRTSVALEDCQPPCVCDANGDSNATATDSLFCLNAAVGLTVALACPCPTTTTTTMPDCMPGELLCTGVCIDPNSDPDNCGSCGGTCGDGQVCVGGLCMPG